MTGWGYHLQGSEQLEVDELGSILSLKIGCAVHYPAFGKRLFECKCGVIFPLYMIKGYGWDMIKQKHEDERELVHDYT